MTDTKPIVLVACCGQKRDFACRAKDLYVSDLFVKSRAYAERFGSEWFVLSAKHGLIEPDAVIEPYDVTLTTMPKSVVQLWNQKVALQFAGLQRPPAITIVLAGSAYCGWIREHHDVARPMAGLGIGQQKAWLKAVLADTHHRAAGSMSTAFNIIAASFAQGFPKLDIGVERRTGQLDRRAEKPEGYRWPEVDRRENEWRRKLDQPNMRAVQRNDHRTFANPDGPEYSQWFNESMP